MHALAYTLLTNKKVRVNWTFFILVNFHSCFILIKYIYFYIENLQTLNTNYQQWSILLLSNIRIGGGCINDTIIHLSNINVGFGGIGESGMGSYHGKAGFNTFSHPKSMLANFFDTETKLRYQPYTDISTKLVRLFLK